MTYKFIIESESESEIADVHKRFARADVLDDLLENLRRAKKWGDHSWLPAQEFPEDDAYELVRMWIIGRCYRAGGME